MMDLDHFKKINDTQGHRTGDEVLQAVSRVMKGCVRSSDVMGRYGGEEFLAILPETSLEKARVAGEKIRHSVEALKVGNPPLHITVSVGVAGIEPNETYDSILSRADALLYAAKRGGRNQIAG